MESRPNRFLGISCDDLAPADTRSSDFDWTGLRVNFIDSADDAQFDLGYDALWREFGHRNEMESRAVLQQRFGWRGSGSLGGRVMRYEMIVVTDGDGQLVAARDHTAVIQAEPADHPMVIHLSHLLIVPRLRGSGLAGWMRVLPLRMARDCLRSANLGPREITLVAEMEPADSSIPGRFGRLVSYERVGFLKIDPARVHYLQPDFRATAEVTADGGVPQPVKLSLIIRRMGREEERVVTGAEVRLLVEALYGMYAESFGPEQMRPNWASLDTYPPPDALVDLVPPTHVPADVAP